MKIHQYQDSSYDDAELMARMVEDGTHRDIIGGLWNELGLLQSNFLKSQGMQSHHSLIDVGCGSLRGGVHFVEYLDPGNYCGVDSNQSFLDVGYDKELAALGLQQRLPRTNLVCTGEFDFSLYDRKFDFALAQSVFTHLTFNRIRQCLENLSPVMAPGGQFYATFFELPEHVSSSTSQVHHPGGIVTYGSSDPYHYRFSDFCHLCNGLPWIPELLGDWGHPRGQKMLRFRFAPHPFQQQQANAPQPNNEKRSLSLDQAASLKPGDEHYRSFVGPPDRFDFMSATQFSLLFASGLREHHRVLDFGCGSLRLGRLLIPFLLGDRYFGIDPNAWLIQDALSRELGWGILGLKRPQFAHNEDFSCTVFDTPFDFIIAQSVATHCGPDLLQKMFREFERALGPEGRILLSFIETKDDAGDNQITGWHYPACVPYTRQTLELLAHDHGLSGTVIPWYHPAATWFMAARSTSLLPQPAQMQCLNGAVLFEPQFAASWQRDECESSQVNDA